jgi:hypothetical protein
MNEEAVEQLAALVARQAATVQAQGRAIDAIIIALHQTLPPLVPLIRQHFAAMSAAVPAELNSVGRQEFQEAAQHLLGKLDSLST